MFSQKSVLARLLANENITVQQGNYETAYFDVKSRVLGLPLWKDMGRDVYDMLVGHEVSHALFTPQNFFEYEGAKDIPHTWLNVVEDVRIEKLILRKYPGLVGNFKRGYTQLMNGEADLFGIRDNDISKMGFMDRLNIHAKARDMIEVPFSDDELPYVAQVKACETYDDVIKACQDIQAWLKEKAENQQEQDGDQSQEGEGDADPIKIGVLTDDSPEGGEPTDETPDIIIDMRENKSGDEAEEEGDTEANGEGQDGEEGDDADKASEEKSSAAEPQSGTCDQEALTDVNFNQNASQLSETGVTYAKGMDPKAARSHIVPYASIAQQRREATQRSVYSWSTEKRLFPGAEYAEFLTETKRVVNLMVKEFEMRKAAWRSLRARESTKGTIDVNKLHKYQYDDMLFKQVSHLADAKNHGMMMLIDYSGSMHNMLPGVIRQTLTLLMFCKRVGIPFEVYAFTSMHAGSCWEPIKEAKRKAASSITRFHDDDLALLELFSSSMPKRDYDEAFRMMFWQSVNRYACSGAFEGLGNTPLNEALIACNYLIDDFRAKHRVQKMNFVTLTDGDSNSAQIKYGVDMPSYRRRGSVTVEVNGKMVELKGGWSRGREDTGALVKAITDKGVTTLNYFIADRNYELTGEICRSLGYVNTTDPAFKAKRKEAISTGVAIFDNNMGYNRRFIVPGKAVNADIDDLNVDADMTTAKIAKAFSKANGSKKKSKVITQKFAELVA